MDMDYRVIKGDIRRFCEHYHGEPFHAVLCDAPYEMAFMNRKWDASGVSFDPGTWERISSLLYPGAFLFVFAGTINDDLISVAMREAGLRKFHRMLGWVYGSGFPKATRIDTQVDEAAGVEVRRGALHPAFAPRSVGYRADEFASNAHSDGNKHEASTHLAKTWEGHRYGGQVLKPAIETILIFQKPYDRRPLDCITKTGAGALNINGGRIGISKQTPGTPRGPSDRIYGKYEAQNQEMTGFDANVGRWPANFHLEHHPDCVPIDLKTIKGDGRNNCSGNRPGGFVNIGADKGESKPNASVYGNEQVIKWRCMESCPVRRLGEQSGKKRSGVAVRRNVGVSGRGWKSIGYPSTSDDVSYHDDGTAARFFFQSHYLYERLESSNPIFYCAKASRKERDAGLGDLPLQIRNRVNPGGLENEPRWAPTEMRNTHPTVKPIALNKWLATLLLPPPEYAPRRILVPFAGSGSEMIGAMLAGWEAVIGVELLRENIDIAQPRLDWWSKWIELGCNDVGAILRDGASLEKETSPEQLAFF